MPDARFAVLYGTAIGLFTATELVALHSRRPGRTFTSQARWVEDHVPGPARWAMRVAILGMSVWGGVHLAEGLA